MVREAGDVIQLTDAARLLAADRTDVAKALARWTKQGWLRRVGHGAYVAASLDSIKTEQIFNDTAVLTGRSLRERSQSRQGATFTLKHIAKNTIFGTKTVWRGHSKIAVSDIHLTIVDMLDDPAIGGGIQHVEGCVRAYLARPDRNDAVLIDYADRLGNGAVFKRLGFLAERAGSNGKALIVPCRERLSQGNAKLDSALDCTRLVSRWKLLAPTLWLKEAAR